MSVTRYGRVAAQSDKPHTNGAGMQAFPALFLLLQEHPERPGHVDNAPYGRS